MPLTNLKSWTMILAAAPLILSASSFAGISVYPISVPMQKSGGAQISVTTNSATTEYVKTTVKKINNPGTAQENETTISQSSGNGIVVTPEKFGLAPGTTRIIRLINIQQPQTEEAYRVYFEGVPGVNNSNDKNEQKSPAKLGISMIWGVLVNVPPATPRLDFTLDPASRVVSNTGNIHLKIESIGLCPQQLTDEGCKWSKPVKNSIYPNQHATLDPALFKGNNYRVVKVKYSNWAEKTVGVKEFGAK
ncbi:P pilus assembly protein, chaperone PapD [Rahnella aquatilis CIP 78.65 = ATCC 33071]|uniref:P pilus assembly protein, chaperone PapD n=2 Tax=Rahnella aquatilis TaxID=34038 RepID=H2J130_RAHAC|nr:P pilus assembly protein, chaperone PapD [Rahnella aquatilis CIP 78.65 = ATCC 33071]